VLWDHPGTQKDPKKPATVIMTRRLSLPRLTRLTRLTRRVSRELVLSLLTSSSLGLDAVTSVSKRLLSLVTLASGIHPITSFFLNQTNHQPAPTTNFVPLSFIVAPRKQLSTVVYPYSSVSCWNSRTSRHGY
jgi:hypothetical protein